MSVKLKKMIRKNSLRENAEISLCLDFLSINDVVAQKQVEMIRKEIYLFAKGKWGK